MTKNVEMIEQRSGRSEGSKVMDIDIEPSFSSTNRLIVNPEITELTCDIYHELQRARDKYVAKKHEMNHRETTITDQDKTKLEQLEKRMCEWQDLLNDALRPESH